MEDREQDNNLIDINDNENPQDVSFSDLLNQDIPAEK